VLDAEECGRRAGPEAREHRLRVFEMLQDVEQGNDVVGAIERDVLHVVAPEGQAACLGDRGVQAVHLHTEHGGPGVSRQTKKVAQPAADFENMASCQASRRPAEVAEGIGGLQPAGIEQARRKASGRVEELRVDPLAVEPVQRGSREPGRRVDEPAPLAGHVGHPLAPAGASPQGCGSFGAAQIAADVFQVRGA
jgi:hypothetical protein